MSKPSELIEVEKTEKKGSLGDAIKKWQKEYDNLSEKLKTAKGEAYLKLFAKRAPFADKLYWARMTSEQRERQLAFNANVKQIVEARGGAVEKVESKLSSKEIEMRKLINQFVATCSKYRHIHTAKPEDVGKIADKAQKEAASIADKIVSKIGDDPARMKKFLTEDEWRDFAGYFDRYKVNRKPIIFDMIIAKKYHHPHVHE